MLCGVRETGRPRVPANQSVRSGIAVLYGPIKLLPTLTPFAVLPANFGSPGIFQFFGCRETQAVALVRKPAFPTQLLDFLPQPVRFPAGFIGNEREDQ